MHPAPVERRSRTGRGQALIAPRTVTVTVTLTLTLLATGGCGTEAGPVLPEPPPPGIDGPGTWIRTLEVAGTPRRYRVHVPSSVDPTVPAPIVLVLHGFPPVDMAVVTGFGAAAEAGGFLAVYPESAWNEDWVQACACTPNGLRGVDDLTFFDALLTDLAGAVAVDPTRRYVVGFSNGGLMAYRLACRRAAAFAGFAGVGAVIWGWHRDHCGPAAPVPLLMIHGTDDPSFPWEGTSVRLVTGGVVDQLPVADHVSFWTDRNRCSGFAGGGVELPDLHDDGTRVVQHDGEGCAAPTRMLEIRGGGHTWPGARVEFDPVLGRRSRDLDATEAVVRFFLGEPAV